MTPGGIAHASTIGSGEIPNERSEGLLDAMLISDIRGRLADLLASINRS
jgi:hypothetical protein